MRRLWRPTGGGHIRSRRSEQHRRTIRALLGTTETTPTRPESPSGDGATDDLDFDWRPEPLGKAFDPDKTFRWPIVIAALFIGVSVALAIRLFVASPADSAGARLDEYRAVSTSLATALRGALDAPADDPEATSVLAVAAAEVREAVSQPLPTGVPLVGQGPGAELAAAHEALTAIVESADSLVARLRIFGDYTRAGRSILTLPLLPTEAPPDLVDAAARTLAEFQAGAVTAAAVLGDEPELAAFRDQVEELLGELTGWSNRYLLALRRDESETTAALLVELRARTDLARAELTARLDEIDGAITTATLSLLSALQEAGLVSA